MTGETIDKAPQGLIPCNAVASATMAGELAHHYGDRVHLLDNPFLRSVLARISSSEGSLPEVLNLVRVSYEMLLGAAVNEFPCVDVEMPTRMAEAHPKEGVYRGSVLDPTTQVVICDVVRAGIVPSQVCFERLLSVLPDASLRLDHLNMSRVSDESGKVTGVDLSGSKIGGTIEGSILLIPDPMGATGSTILRAVEHYTESYGKPRMIITMPMIATPEYLRALLDGIEGIVIYAGRLDRGLSSPEVLATLPGAHWDEECGLNERSYIVPGAGGMGEVLNNSWC
ncbi:MAG: uracil phosphoribosyltransferase [Planctomycetota bacterium]|jgi:uracil phosphoribosyltransferase